MGFEATTLCSLDECFVTELLRASKHISGQVGIFPLLVVASLVFTTAMGFCRLSSKGVTAKMVFQRQLRHTGYSREANGRCCHIVAGTTCTFGSAEKSARGRFMHIISCTYEAAQPSRANHSYKCRARQIIM